MGLISTCALATPPRVYGGTELIVSELARELRDLGHQPTVFATGDSTCAGARGALFAHPVSPPDSLAELRHAGAAWAQIAASDDFDLVHVHRAEALPFASFVPVPAVATVHHDRDASRFAHYLSYPDISFVAVSRRQAELAWEVPFRAVIHHGLDSTRYPLGNGGKTCVFLGRISPEKGPHHAIEAARRTKTPLLLAGRRRSVDCEYFEREIGAHVQSSGAAWIGDVDHKRKVELLSSARCLLFPIEWEEPFGLVMIEAMLVGTPVIAFACGAASEVVEDGVTGFLVHGMEEMCRRIRDVGGIDRKTCRARAVQRWSSARMAREYAALYLEAIDHWAVTRSRSATHGNGGSEVLRAAHPR